MFDRLVAAVRAGDLKKTHNIQHKKTGPNMNSILIGVTDTKCPLFDYLIVLGKLYLWNCRRNNSLPFFSSYRKLVRRKYETERHIAASIIM